MKKKMQIVFGLILMALFFYSCQRDETAIVASAKSEENSGFDIFSNNTKKGTASRGTDTHYQEGFRYLYSRYFELNPEEAPDFTDTSKPLVDFRFASQVFYEKDSAKFVLFPIVQNRKIIDIMVATVNKDETYVDFYYAEKDKVINGVIAEFTARAGGVVSGEETPPPRGDHLIEEVVITVPVPVKPLKQSLYIDIVDYAHLPPGGGCTIFGNCPGGGGPVGPVMPQTPTQGNPCAKTKAMLGKPAIQQGIINLKSQSTLGGENGFKAKADGATSPMIFGGPHSVNFGDKTGWQGGYHNHTPAGIPMLTPRDIVQLLGFARAQGNNGDPTKAFVGMVAPNGMHYVISFTGNYQDTLLSFTDEKLDGLTILMAMRSQLNSSSTNEDYESLFFESLKDMSLEGKVSLQRIENSGAVKTINNNGEPVSC